MQYIPKNYQVYGTNRIIENAEVGALVDMGLGKTVMTLTAIVELFKQEKIRKVLVIAPKKVAESVWTDERDKWDHTKHLTISLILGDQRQRRLALSKPAHIYCINRENVAWLIGLLGGAWPFDFVVIDELSSFKNPKSQRFKALKLVRSYMKRVVGLTGTPAPNGLLDLWSQLFLLDKGRSLGDSFTKFRSTYFETDKRNGHIVFSYKLRKGNMLLGDDFYHAEILDRIKNTCFSMKTEDYLQLPDRIDNNIKIILPADIQAKYEAFEKELVLQLADKEITALNAAGLTNKLLQFANGAIYDDKKVWHAVHEEKLTALDEIIESLEGKPLLIFYSFISDKERIISKYKFARELKTPQDIKDWNDGKIKLLIAHPASAGHGLNLQFGGQNILWFGLPWSLELYLQGLKRIHRNGVANIVMNNRLIVKGTMDEDVLRALLGKDSLQNAVIKAVKARIEKYSKFVV